MLSAPLVSSPSSGQLLVTGAQPNAFIFFWASYDNGNYFGPAGSWVADETGTLFFAFPPTAQIYVKQMVNGVESDYSNVVIIQ